MARLIHGCRHIPFYNLIYKSDHLSELWFGLRWLGYLGFSMGNLGVLRIQWARASFDRPSAESPDIRHCVIDVEGRSSARDFPLIIRRLAANGLRDVTFVSQVCSKVGRGVN